MPFHAPFGGHVKSGRLAQWPDGCKEARKTAGRWGAGADRRGSRRSGAAMPPESTAVIATVAEPAVEVMDREMGKLGGEVTRRPVFEVLDELEASEAAAEAAAREARRELHETRKAELTADLDERVGKLKEKLHVA